MPYLYGSKKNVDRRLVATFGSEQQLFATLVGLVFELTSAFDTSEWSVESPRTIRFSGF